MACMILVLDLQQNSGKTAENVLKLIILLIKSGFVERKCVILYFGLELRLGSVLDSPLSCVLYGLLCPLGLGLV